MPLDIPQPIYRNNIGQFVTSTDINALIKAAGQLDQLSYRQRPAFCMSNNLYVPGDTPREDFRVWHGTVQRVNAMSQIVVEGFHGKEGSETLEISLFGVVQATVTATGAFTVTITVNAGNAQNNLYELDVWKRGTTNKTGIYYIYGVYGTGFSLSTAWPGVPTFTTSYPATQLNQLVNAANWLYDRMALLPRVPFLGQLYTNGTYKVDTYQLFTGSVYKIFTEDILRIYGSVRCSETATESRLEVYLNGSLAATFPSSGYLTPGATVSFSLPISLSSVTNGTRADVMLQEEVTASTYDSGVAVGINSKWTFEYIGIDNAAGGYPITSLPALTVANGNYTQAQLTTIFNTIATSLSDTKARIDANPVLWNRLYAMRKSYGKNDQEITKGAKVFVYTIPRQFDKLVVRGKDVHLAWGYRAVEQEFKDGQLLVEWTGQTDEAITSGEDTETQVIYLDNKPGLKQQQQYLLYADTAVNWIGEYMT